MKGCERVSTSDKNLDAAASEKIRVSDEEKIGQVILEIQEKTAEC